jgi:hypothetical protein
VTAQRLEHRVRADPQYPRDVSNAATIETQRDDLLKHLLATALIAILNDELAAASPAQILLFSVRGCAILLNVPSGTPRTSDSYGLHDLSLTCPSLFISA